VHFAGEHTSVAYQGFMEGGAESGFRAAGEILADYRIRVRFPAGS
jgi:monoamine oxidase